MCVCMRRRPVFAEGRCVFDLLDTPLALPSSSFQQASCAGRNRCLSARILNRDLTDTNARSTAEKAPLPRALVSVAVAGVW